MTRFLSILLLTILVLGCGGEPETFDELQAAGTKAFVTGEYPTARRYLGRALDIKSSDRDVLYFMGLACRREYYMDSAFYYLKRAGLLFPYDREVNIALYEVALELKEWQSALEAIRILVETGDSPEQYAERAADLNIKTENFFVAYLQYSKLYEQDRENPVRYLQLANVAARVDSVRQAIALMDTAMVKFGERIEFLQNQAIFYTAVGDRSMAEKRLRQIIALDSTQSVAKLTLANILSFSKSREEREEALELFRELQAIPGSGPKLDSAIQALEADLGSSN